MNFKRLTLSILCLTAFSFFWSCSDDDSSTGAEGTARVAVRLVDAPGDFEAVNIDVQDVVIKYNGDDEEVEIGTVATGVYDLLELTGGVSALLVDDEVPAGDISQIRLVLGENNTIQVDGEVFDLSTPSAQQSGLKLQVNETLEDGILYEFILDFMVEQSIVTQGNGSYSLKPVIRATTVAESGAISAAIAPVGTAVEVTATDGITTVSTFANADGAVLLSGVPEGVYSVSFVPEASSGFEPITIDEVNVSTGEITSIGDILFE